MIYKNVSTRLEENAKMGKGMKDEESELRNDPIEMPTLQLLTIEIDCTS